MFFKPFEYYIMRPPERMRLMCLSLINSLKYNDGPLSELSDHSVDKNISKISYTNWNKNLVETESTVRLKYFFANYLVGFYGPRLKKKHKRDFDVDNIWYQIYDANSGDYHGWHDHMPNPFLSNIWYLELPKDHGTEFKVKNKIIKPKVKTGDLIVFPPNILHRSPPNDSNETKSIVSFNLMESTD